VLSTILAAGRVHAARQIEAVTFVSEAGEFYLPVSEAAEALNRRVEADGTGRCMGLNGRPLKADAIRYFIDGSRVVMQSRISSGRGGSTPTGEFRAGPYKAKSRYLNRYYNAPMPWSVQIHGHVFVHGFTSVPNYPASHGCIRLPLTGFNPAKIFLRMDQHRDPRPRGQRLTGISPSGVGGCAAPPRTTITAHRAGRTTRSATLTGHSHLSPEHPCRHHCTIWPGLIVKPGTHKSRRTSDKDFS
jgi:hypothetical protein